MFRSILVPLDGSAPAEWPLPLAFDAARRAGAVLHLAHVYLPDEPWRDFDELTPYQFEGETATEPEYEREAKQDQQRYLDAVARVGRDRGVTVVPTVLDGSGVVDALERHARVVGADLVVMAALSGHHADALVSRLTAPVLASRPSPDMKPDPAAAPPSIDRILIPLDGSELSEQVLGPAAELGRVWDAHCTLFRAVSPGGQWAGGSGGANGDGIDEARSYLQQVAERISNDWVSVDTVAVEELHVAKAIQWTAGHVGADMIAVATHGRGGLSRMVFGSVAHKVLSDATLPVMLHRPEPPSD